MKMTDLSPAPPRPAATVRFLAAPEPERFFGLARTVNAAADWQSRLEQDLGDMQFLLFCSTGPLDLSPAAEEALAALPGLLGVGCDHPVADHGLLLDAGKVIVENLWDLEDLADRPALLAAWPVRQSGDSRGGCSPVRAVVMEAPAGIYYPK